MTGELTEDDPELEFDESESDDGLGDVVGALVEEPPSSSESERPSSPEVEPVLVLEECDPTVWELAVDSTVECHRATPAMMANAELPTASTAVTMRARRFPRILGFIATPFRGMRLLSTLGTGSSNFLRWAGREPREADDLALRPAGRGCPRGV